MYHSFHKNIKQHNFKIFNIYYRNKYLLSTKSLTLLPKDHMTLKTIIMTDYWVLFNKIEERPSWHISTYSIRFLWCVAKKLFHRNLLMLISQSKHYNKSWSGAHVRDQRRVHIQLMSKHKPKVKSCETSYTVFISNKDMFQYHCWHDREKWRGLLTEGIGMANRQSCLDPVPHHALPIGLQVLRDWPLSRGLKPAFISNRHNVIKGYN